MFARCCKVVAMVLLGGCYGVAMVLQGFFLVGCYGVAMVLLSVAMAFLGGC